MSTQTLTHPPGFAEMVETIIGAYRLTDDEAATVRQTLALAPFVPQGRKDTDETLGNRDADHVAGRGRDVGRRENGESLILGGPKLLLGATGSEGGKRDPMMGLGQDGQRQHIDGPISIHAAPSPKQGAASPFGTHRTTPATTPFQRWNGEAWTPDTGGDPMDPSEQPQSPAPPLAPNGNREDKFLTQDGAIWPVSRVSMTEPAAIRRRMAEDFRDILRDRGRDPFAAVTTDDLIYRGWTREQVRLHGADALDVARGGEA